MNEIERAIRSCQEKIRKYKRRLAGPDFHRGSTMNAISLEHVKIAALKEKQEREKGCVWCKEDNKVFHDGQHFHMFCSYCGKRLEVEQDG